MSSATLFQALAMRLDALEREVERLRLGEVPARANLSATSAPTSGHDELDGYGAGSLWVDQAAARAYVCISAAAGAAVWKAIT